MCAFQVIQTHCWVKNQFIWQTSWSSTNGLEINIVFLIQTSSQDLEMGNTWNQRNQDFRNITYVYEYLAELFFADIHFTGRDGYITYLWTNGLGPFMIIVFHCRFWIMHISTKEMLKPRLPNFIHILPGGLVYLFIG